jgi:hypothetical protein
MDLELRNRRALDRLRSAANALSDGELCEPIDPPWTAAGLFAHLAFWERFTHGRWIEARDSGSAIPIPFEDLAMELVNRAGLPGWLATSPRDAVEQCLAAGSEIDTFIGSLQPEIVSRVLEEGRPRLVDRSIHRSEHLGTIEAAFPDRFSR